MTLAEEVAAAYVRSAHEEIGDHSPKTLQELIDAVGDHNQLMIDAIEETSPDVARLVAESMAVEMASTSAVWVAVTNSFFNAVGIMLELESLQ